MTRCVDFYKKWKSEPNFCGLGLGSARDVDKYLSLIEILSQQSDIPEGKFYKYLPLSAAKSLLLFRTDSEIYRTATKKITDDLKKVQSPFTSKDIKKLLYLDKNESVVPRYHFKNPHAKTKGERISAITRKTKLITTTELLTTGQRLVLRKIMEKYDKDNEYSALSFIIRWASEKLLINEE